MGNWLFFQLLSVLFFVQHRGKAPEDGLSSATILEGWQWKDGNIPWMGKNTLMIGCLWYVYGWWWMVVYASASGCFLAPLFVCGCFLWIRFETEFHWWCLGQNYLQIGKGMRVWTHRPTFIYLFLMRSFLDQKVGCFPACFPSYIPGVVSSTQMFVAEDHHCCWLHPQFCRPSPWIRTSPY